MNTKTFFKVLPLAVALMLCSCHADEDSLISMRTDIAIKNNGNNDTNPLASTIPTGWDTDHDTGNMYGYVDLGLSVDWAICDLGANYTPSQDLLDLMESTGGSTSNNSNIQYLTLAEYNELIRAITSGSSSGTTSNIFDYIADNYSAHYYAWGDPNEQNMFYYHNPYHPTGNWYAPDNYGGDPDYDSASRRLGNKWATPTLDQWNELIENCSVTKMPASSGVKAYIFTGPNGKSVAFTVNHCIKGHYYGEGSHTMADELYYLTSTKSGKEEECYIVCGSYWGSRPELIPGLGDTYNGYHIRPVRRKN